MADDYDILFKIVIIGDSGVGKTNLVSRYMRNTFEVESKATIGVEFGEKKFKKNGKKIKAQLWDTAGQERYRSISSVYYKGSKGALIVYDITSKKSFTNVEKWYNEVKKQAEPNLTMILVGNKSDLINERDITKEEGKEKAKTLGIPFFETSALNKSNVEEAFNLMIDEILNNNTFENLDDFEMHEEKENFVSLATDKKEQKETDSKGCC